MEKKVDKELKNLDLRLFIDENPDFKLFIITSHPRSDMGKGHLTLAFSRQLKNVHIIKYDGILNLSIGDKYIFDEIESDDFLLYRQNGALSFSTSNSLMLGDIVSQFLLEYGRNIVNFSLRPHIAEFTIQSVYNKWVELGRPNNLLIEIGGTLSDRETEPIWPYFISKLRNIIGYDRVSINLLSEVSMNGSKVKTKGLQSSVDSISATNVSVDNFFIRLPKGVTDYTQEEIKKRIERKLAENSNLYISTDQVVLVPFSEIDVKGVYEKAVLELLSSESISTTTYDKI
jgi:CTP synthase (UTP-ammonia lyase)